MCYLQDIERTWIYSTSLWDADFLFKEISDRFKGWIKCTFKIILENIINFAEII